MGASRLCSSILGRRFQCHWRVWIGIREERRYHQHCCNIAGALQSRNCVVMPFMECQCGEVHLPSIDIIDVPMPGSWLPDTQPDHQARRTGYQGPKEEAGALTSLRQRMVPKSDPQGYRVCSQNHPVLPMSTEQWKCNDNPPYLKNLYQRSHNIDYLLDITIQQRQTHNATYTHITGQSHTRNTREKEFSELSAYIDDVAKQLPSPEAEVLAASYIICPYGRYKLTALYATRPSRTLCTRKRASCMGTFRTNPKVKQGNFCYRPAHLLCHLPGVYRTDERFSTASKGISGAKIEEWQGRLLRGGELSFSLGGEMCSLRLV